MKWGVFMTYNPCWYKAFSCSCAVHLLLIMLLTMLLGNIDSRTVPERHIVIELTEGIGRNSQDNEPAQAGDIAPAANTRAFPDNEASPTATPLMRGPSTNRTLADGESPVVATAAAAVAGGSSQGVVAQPVAGSGPGVTGSLKPVGGGELDNIINAFLLQIEKCKDYPYLARRRGQTGTVTVAVRLSAAGELAGVQVVHSSGVAALDEAALTLVRKVCPFVHNAGRTIAMNIPIAYQLD
jgi:protein TonB